VRSMTKAQEERKRREKQVRKEEERKRRRWQPKKQSTIKLVKKKRAAEEEEDREKSKKRKKANADDDEDLGELGWVRRNEKEDSAETDRTGRKEQREGKTVTDLVSSEEEEGINVRATTKKSRKERRTEEHREQDRQERGEDVILKNTEDQSILEITTERLRQLVTAKMDVHDSILCALCEKGLPETTREEVMVWGPDVMKGAGRTTEEWIRILGPRRQQITPNTRMLLPLVDGHHYSLIDIHLGRRTVQHHDSLRVHSGNKRWEEEAARLAEGILSQLEEGGWTIRRDESDRL